MHMELNVFQKALSIAINRGDSFTIGGGEPTMHPRFFEYLNLVRKESERGNFEIAPFMVTNGKAYGKASRLLDILERDYELGLNTISVSLSQDNWHEPIDRRIIERYTRLRRITNGFIDFRSVTKIAPSGRGRHSQFNEMRMTGSQCACQTPLIDSEGMVWSCGCKTHLLGSIWDENVLDEYKEEFAHEGGREVDLVPALQRAHRRRRQKALP